MGKYAVVNNDFVENVIVLDETQIEEMSAALNAELVDAIPYGLCIGDWRIDGKWSRNIDGIQVILEPLTPEQQTDYAGLRDEVEAMNEVFLEAEAALTEGVESIG